MSAGNFSRSRYEASYAANAIHPIRVQPETLAAATVGGTPVSNAPPTAGITNPISAVSSLGRRAKGLKPRMVTLQLPVATTPPTGYSVGSIVRLPILTEALFESLNTGDEMTYLSVTWDVVSTSPEEVA